MEVSDDMVHFLDMWVIREGNRLITTLYTKPTDAYNFLRFDSSHPLHCRRGIPIGQFLRLRRICTHTADFVSNSLVKAKQFLERGYPRELIFESLPRALGRDRPTLLSHGRPQSTSTDTDTLSQQILVTTFHPAFKGLGPLVRANWDIIGVHTKPSFCMPNSWSLAYVDHPTSRISLLEHAQIITLLNLNPQVRPIPRVHKLTTFALPKSADTACDWTSQVQLPLIPWGGCIPQRIMCHVRVLTSYTALNALGVTCSMWGRQSANSWPGHVNTSPRSSTANSIQTWVSTFVTPHIRVWMISDSTSLISSTATHSQLRLRS